MYKPRILRAFYHILSKEAVNNIIQHIFLQSLSLYHQLCIRGEGRETQTTSLWTSTLNVYLSFIFNYLFLMFNQVLVLRV